MQHTLWSLFDQNESFSFALTMTVLGIQIIKKNILVMAAFIKFVNSWPSKSKFEFHEQKHFQSA